MVRDVVAAVGGGAALVARQAGRRRGARLLQRRRDQGRQVRGERGRKPSRSSASQALVVEASPKPIRPCRPTRAKNSSGRRTVVVTALAEDLAATVGDVAVGHGSRWTATVKTRPGDDGGDGRARSRRDGVEAGPRSLAPVRRTTRWSWRHSGLFVGGSRVDAKSARQSHTPCIRIRRARSDACWCGAQRQHPSCPARGTRSPASARAEVRAVVGSSVTAMCSRSPGAGPPARSCRRRRGTADVQLLLGARATLRVRVHEVRVPVAIGVVHLDDRPAGVTVAVEAPEDADRVEAVPEARG